jgi:hypothetical protein
MLLETLNVLAAGCAVVGQPTNPRMRIGKRHRSPGLSKAEVVRHVALVTGRSVNQIATPTLKLGALSRGSRELVLRFAGGGMGTVTVSASDTIRAC